MCGVGLNKHQLMALQQALRNRQMGEGVGGDKRDETGICGQVAAARTARWHGISVKAQFGVSNAGAGSSAAAAFHAGCWIVSPWRVPSGRMRVDRLGSIRAWLWLRALHLRGLAGFHAVRPGTARA